MEYFDLPLPSSSASSSSTAHDGPRGFGAGEASGTDTVKQEGQEEVTGTPVGTPLDHPGAISVSTAFYPSLMFDGTLPDLILVSSDGVHFYIHLSRIVAVSSNRLGGLLPPNLITGSSPPSFRSILAPHPADVLNVLLHTIYGLSCRHYLPPLETVDATLSALVQNGVPPQPLATPNQPLYLHMLSFAPNRPIDAYAVAAHHALEDAAVAISSHLLAYDLRRLPDEPAEKMGPLYLKRLFLLHQTRIGALRDILFRPPQPHPLTNGVGCTVETQQQLTRAWALVVAQLVWDVIPSTSISALKSLLDPIGTMVGCDLCAAALRRRVQEVEYEWSSVRTTI